MNKPIAIVVGLLLLILLLLFSMTYTVRFSEVAIKATFGRTTDNSVVQEPGLHFRWPIFIDKVTKLDTRLQLVETPLEEITTRDGLQVVVRAFLLWRVDADSPTGPLEFHKRHGTIDDANESLFGEFRTACTGALSEFDFHELFGVESRLEDAEQAIQAKLAALGERGIRPVTVGIKQLLLPPRTSKSVLSRMNATRDTLSESERGKGNAEAQSIRSEANTNADKIVAFANQRAEEIRALGEEQAAQYLREMAEDEQLAVFLSWLDALEQSLSDYTTVILPGDIAPWHLMNMGSAVGESPIPQPPTSGRGNGSAQDPPESVSAAEPVSPDDSPASEREGT